MKDYLLYPGCSMEASARAYDDSLKAIAKPMGLNLKEIDDWNCCGATEYLGISRTPAYALIARNLAIAANEVNGTQHSGGSLLGLLSEPGQGRSQYGRAAEARLAGE